MFYNYYFMEKRQCFFFLTACITLILQIWFKNGHLYVSITTSNKGWTVFTPCRSTEFFHVEISWSEQFGLSLFINKKLHTKTIKFVHRKDIVISTHIFIGTTFEKKHFGRFSCSGWTLVNIVKKIKDSLKIDSGKE